MPAAPGSPGAGAPWAAAQQRLRLQQEPPLPLQQLPSADVSTGAQPPLEGDGRAQRRRALWKVAEARGSATQAAPGGGEAPHPAGHHSYSYDGRQGQDRPLLPSSAPAATAAAVAAAPPDGPLGKARPHRRHHDLHGPAHSVDAREHDGGEGWEEEDEDEAGGGGSGAPGAGGAAGEASSCAPLDVALATCALHGVWQQYELTTRAVWLLLLGEYRLLDCCRALRWAGATLTPPHHHHHFPASHIRRPPRLCTPALKPRSPNGPQSSWSAAPRAPPHGGWGFAWREAKVCIEARARACQHA